MRLVNVGAGKFEMRDVPAACILGQGFGGALEGQVYLCLDPGEWPQIEFACRVHVVSCLLAQATLKPATEPFSSLARAVSSSTASAVRCVPAVVCSVIRRMSCISLATCVAELA